MINQNLSVGLLLLVQPTWSLRLPPNSEQTYLTNGD